jgi:hypothetical protein
MKTFKHFPHRQAKEVIILTVIIFVLIFILFAFTCPLKTYTQVLEAKKVTGNFIFAGDIEYNGERIGASSELCTYVLFHKSPQIDEYHVIVKEGLFFVRRYPDPKFHKIYANGEDQH